MVRNREVLEIVVELRVNPQRRAYYDLEDLWSDAKRVDFSKETPTA